MTRIDEPITVGTYVSEPLARAAAEHLASAEIDEARVNEVSEQVWQVQVPWRLADRATRELSDHERRAIQTH